MMNGKTITNGIVNLRSAYPGFYKNYNNEDYMALAKLWAKYFAKFNDDDLDVVLQKWIAAHNFPPCIKELLDEFKSLEIERMVAQKPVPWKTIDIGGNIYQ